MEIRLEWWQRLDLRSMISKMTTPEERNRRDLMSWCHTHHQPYPTWMTGPLQYMGYPYGHREQLLCRLNTRWRDRQDPGPYDKRIYHGVDSLIS